MASVVNIAANGLQAAARRFSASANRVANAINFPPTDAGRLSSSGSFAPQRIFTDFEPVGRVRTNPKAAAPSPVAGADISDSTDISSFPNINLFAEYLDQKQALVAYKANASVIRVQQDLDELLLDIET